MWEGGGGRPLLTRRAFRLRYTEEMEAHKLAASGHAPYGREATKKPTRLRVNGGEDWLEENREAIEAYNELVARDGVFSTGSRDF